MGTNSKLAFEIECMVKQTHHFETPVVQTKECTDCNIVESGFNSPMKCVKSPLIITFERIRRMNCSISLMVIGLLKNLISTNTRLFKYFKFGHLHWSSIDIN